MSVKKCEKSVDVDGALANERGVLLGEPHAPFNIFENQPIDSLPIEKNDSLPMDDDEPKPKKKRGNPNMVKGAPSLNPAGKPKGTRNKAVLLREKLEEMGFNPLLQYVKIVKKEYINKQDETKAKLLWNLIDASSPREKINENHNTSDNTLTVVHQFGLMPPEEFLEEKRRLGIIDADCIEVDNVQSADREEGM
jgi:hypothetical protein